MTSSKLVTLAELAAALKATNYGLPLRKNDGDSLQGRAARIFTAIPVPAWKPGNGARTFDEPPVEDAPDDVAPDPPALLDSLLDEALAAEYERGRRDLRLALQRAAEAVEIDLKREVVERIRKGFQKQKSGISPKRYREVIALLDEEAAK